MKGLSESISAIVMKLLAKMPEERYQTASGVEADLRRCLAALDSTERIDPFPLGMHDMSDRLLIPEKLYGREQEIHALFAAFDRVVAEGTPEVVLMSGYSGVGKSSVVNELYKAISFRDGRSLRRHANSTSTDGTSLTQRSRRPFGHSLIRSWLEVMRK